MVSARFVGGRVSGRVGVIDGRSLGREGVAVQRLVGSILTAEQRGAWFVFGRRGGRGSERRVRPTRKG